MFVLNEHVEMILSYKFMLARVNFSFILHVETNYYLDGPNIRSRDNCFSVLPILVSSLLVRVTCSELLSPFLF